VNDIRQFALWEECCAGVYFLLRSINQDHHFLQIIQKIVCAQRLGIHLILKNQIACGRFSGFQKYSSLCCPDSHEQSLMFYRFKGGRKTGEGSLHPQPKGWGIRDPLRSRSNKELIGKKLRLAVQKMVYEFCALGPSALDRRNEDVVIEKIP